MSKVFFCFALNALLLAPSGPGPAQQPKPYRIGAIQPGGPISMTIDGLRQGLKDLGLQEGKQYTLAIKDTKGDVKATEQAARKFEKEKVDLIYAITTVQVDHVHPIGHKPSGFHIYSLEVYHREPATHREVRNLFSLPQLMWTRS